MKTHSNPSNRGGTHINAEKVVVVNEATFDQLNLDGRASESQSSLLPMTNAGKDRVSKQEQRLAENLQELISRRDTLREIGEGTSDEDMQILSLRRELRVGGILHRGDSLGEKYALREELGTGGFATVWRAETLNNNVDVAIKVLHAQSAKNPIKRDRFFRGARVMQQLDHDGVVNVLDAECHDDGFYYFVMEYISGGNLYEAVLEKRIEPSDGIAVTCQILDALSYSHEHSRRFVHRDVKPQNVLVRSGNQVLLTDFDLVAATDTTGGTQTGMLGTVHYAAPEQWHRPQEADQRADIYSSALTGMFVLAGKELSGFDVIRAPKVVVDSLPIVDGLKDVFLRAIEFDPSSRFQTAAEFRDALLAPPKTPRKRKARRRKSPGNSLPEVRTASGQKKRYPLPRPTKNQIHEAFKIFDDDYRATTAWVKFRENRSHRYAIKSGDQLYPVKMILELAGGKKRGNLSGTLEEYRKIVVSLGFEVIEKRLHEPRTTDDGR